MFPYRANASFCLYQAAILRGCCPEWTVEAWRSSSWRGVLSSRTGKTYFFSRFHCRRCFVNCPFLFRRSYAAFHGIICRITEKGSLDGVCVKKFRAASLRTSHVGKCVTCSISRFLQRLSNFFSHPAWLRIVSAQGYMASISSLVATT